MSLFLLDIRTYVCELFFSQKYERMFYELLIT